MMEHRATPASAMIDNHFRKMELVWIVDNIPELKEMVNNVDLTHALQEKSFL
jgi:hypothetical protein